MQVKWVCTQCGARMSKSPGQRPLPGVCPRKPKYGNGMGKPHSWVKEG